MKKGLPFLRLILFFILITGYNRIQASHSVGADLTYKCLGSNKYLVSLVFYRDCNGIAAPSSVSVSIVSASSGYNFYEVLNPVPGTGQEVTPVCLSQKTTCSGGNFPGIQEWKYEGIVTLPAKSADWVISFSSCCRNNAITTINSPGGENLYVEAKLNNTSLIGCNSSPVFSNKPVPFVCIGQYFCFNHGAVDPEGDSLAYALMVPATSDASAVNYLQPFSANQPLASTPPMSFNSQTGDICVTPTKQLVTVMAVLVKEYRQGKLIGSVIRDIQVNIINCSNTIPSLTGIDGNPPNLNNTQLTACAGTPIDFNIKSSDPDIGQVVTMTWNKGISAGDVKFITTGSPYPTGKFTWTPKTSDISNTPYCFTVTVADNNCPYFGTFTQSYCITVSGLSVKLGPDKTVSCKEPFVTLAAQVSGGTGKYSYSWSNGKTTSSITAGSGKYHVAVSDGSGCIGFDTINVSNTGVLAAAFTSITGCQNEPVQFTDLSISGASFIESWKWDFGVPGATASTKNPSYTYTAPGSYTVKLTVTNNMGCKDSIIKKINVGSPPVANYVASGVCLGELTAFTNASSVVTGDISGFSWNFGEPSSGAANISDQEHPVHTYKTAGTFHVSLTVTSNTGCTATKVMAVVVNPLPTTTFSVSNVCFGDQTIFTDNSYIDADSITARLWDFGDPVSGVANSSTAKDPTHIYKQPGIYNVSLTTTSGKGCKSTTIRSISFSSIPVASFTTVKDVCLGNISEFKNTSSVANGTITSWEWNFGEPSSGSSNTSAAEHPQHTYGLAGTYQVTLRITTSNGCQNTYVSSVNIHPPMLVDFSTASVCIGDTTLFSDLSVIQTGSIQSWSWNFGDPVSGTNNTAHGKNVAHVYASAGSYMVLLTLTSDKNCQSTLTKAVNVYPNPISAFKFTEVCAGSATSFTNLSSVTGSTIISSAWDFEDTGSASDSSYLEHPAHLYQEHGNYIVSLTTTTANGCKNTIAQPVAVHPNPMVEFASDIVCYNNYTQFKDSLSIAAGSISSLNWDFGDGSSTNINNPAYKYKSAGNYAVVLTVISNKNCSTSRSKTVVVKPAPIAAFKNTSVCYGATTEFKDFSVADGNIKNWTWDFGDASPAVNTRDAQHFYAKDSMYQVTLKVTGNNGCISSTTKEVGVYSNPDVNFKLNVTNGCAGEKFEFTDLTKVSYGKLTQWLWDFGDGYTSNMEHPTHWYKQAGNYTITLKVLTDAGCTSSLALNDWITVYPVPVSDFSMSNEVTTVLNSTIHFTDKSQNAVSWFWDFGDAQQSTETNPTHFYSSDKPGTYVASLLVTNTFGCTDTSYQKITINPDASFYMPNSFTPNGDGMNDVFKGKGTGVSEFKLWIMNRWGNIIFYSEDINQGWDGKTIENGEISQEDIYVWMVELTDAIGKRRRFNGHVTLMR